MEVEIDGTTLPKGYDLVIPPLRNTNPLELPPGEVVATEIARKQLENLNRLERKPKKKTTASDTEMSTEQPSSTVEFVHVQKVNSNLSSSIVSKAELEDEVRQKVAKLESTAKKVIGTIEIPQDIILSGLNTTPITKSTSGETVQMHDQELIDILEGKSDDTGLYEIVQDNHGNVIVTDTAVSADNNSYEIVTEAKAKLMEREIAMRQIASLPMRKNKKVNQSTTPQAAAAQAQSIVQSLAAEWTDDDKDDEMILEVVNLSNDVTEPAIKILNMTILNETPDSKPKLPLPRTGELPVEPRILNKNAPKILNINASAAEPATFKRSRVVKKKEIWDPSSDKKTATEKISLSLPPSITIKKVTKETITKANTATADSPVPVTVQKAPAKKGKKLSEIDKLLQDEGAVNMIYSLERENNNRDVPEIGVNPDQKLLIDKSQEKSSLVTKAKAIKNVVLKQSTSPSEVKAPGRARAKRDLTPLTSEPKVVVPKVTACRKKKADNTWDYIYSQAQATCDDAMIIRRRSNSSYSSSAASPRRMSVDVNESLESPPPSSKKMKTGNKDGFEFTKPPQKNKKSPADDVLKRDFVEQLRGKISTVITKNKEKSIPVAPKGKKRGASAASEASTAKRFSERRSNGSDSKEYKVEKIQTATGAVTHITINQNPLSISLLSEMKSLLNQIETDGSNVVLITSSEGFSEGLDYSALVQPTVDKRKQAASDLVTALKNFLISLAAFPKPLICGVDGLVSGISVAMLPLFDLVLASPSAAFSLPHAKIGANPEGISILKQSGKVNVNAVIVV